MVGEGERLQAIEELKGELEKLRKQNAALEVELKFRKEQIQALLKRIYGRRSERIVVGQLELPRADAEVDAALVKEVEESCDEEAPRRSRRNGRKPLPKELPRKRKEIHPEPEDQICKCCGKQMRPIGEDITEILEYQPAQCYIEEVARIKYACADCQEGVVTPPLPPRPIEKGRPGPGMLAQVAVAKYADHIPLYRQEQILGRQGIDVSRKTLCDWLGASASLLKPIVVDVKRQLFEEHMLQSDDTYVQYRDKTLKGATRRGYIWVYCIPWGEVVYDFTTGRAGEYPLKFLQGYRGHLQSDGFGAYNDLFRTGDVVHIGCMAHLRRKFFEAREEAPDESQAVVNLIRKLYRIEREAKDLGLDPMGRVELRQREAAPIFDRLRTYIDVIATKALPQSKLGQAITYAVGQWQSIRRYLEVGEAEIDNNSAENAMRAVVLGRKNWMALGNAEGGGLRATVFYSLIVSCKRLGIEPFAYLRDVIDRVSTHPASQIRELTPRGWKETLGRQLTQAGGVEGQQ